MKAIVMSLNFTMFPWWIYLSLDKSQEPRKCWQLFTSKNVFFPRIDTPESPIISGMLAATEGQLVSVNCSVNYYCPSRPPILHWIWERGDQLNITKPPEIQTVFPEHHRPLMLASLSFTVSHRIKPRLRCEASYPGAKALTASKDLHVTCEDIFVILQRLYSKFTF